MYAVTVDSRRSGGIENTGTTCSSAASSDPITRCATPAPTRICAQFAITFGSPASRAASAVAAARSARSGLPVLVATDSAKIACRPVENDYADCPESLISCTSEFANFSRCL